MRFIGRRRPTHTTTHPEATTAKLKFTITMSLDGSVAGPRQSLEKPARRGGEGLHEWAFATRCFRAAHRIEGGETGPPFHTPVFVLTHRPREPIEMQGGTTFHFVTDGIEAALERAMETAAGQDVAIGGGAETAQQYLRAGLIGEMAIHVVPLLLGSGSRLFENLGGGPSGYECTELVSSPAAAHYTYAVTSSQKT